MDDGKLTSWYELKKELDKLMSKEKKAVFEECMKVTSKINQHTSKKAITEYKNWLKDLVFEKNDLRFDHEKKWLRIKGKHYKFKTDSETAAWDAAEERYYDGDLG